MALIKRADNEKGENEREEGEENSNERQLKFSPFATVKKRLHFYMK
jgi:hypothetical protein